MNPMTNREALIEIIEKSGLFGYANDCAGFSDDGEPIEYMAEELANTILAAITLESKCRFSANPNDWEEEIVITPPKGGDDG